MNSKQRSILNNFMNSVYQGKRKFNINLKRINNWQALCLLWNEVNSIQIKYSIICNAKKYQPCYNSIKPNKFPISKNH